MKASLALLALFVFVSAVSATTAAVEEIKYKNPLNTCGGNCPSNDCPGCPCGTARADQDVAAVCARYSGWNQACCQCIVKHESSGNANAANYNTNGSYDVGVWQINNIHWGACNGGKAPCDVESNLKCAIEVWNERKSFGPWSTCKGCGCC
eukprot:TRINITY_DN53_c0_g2_i2.p1 TRINITY_DN53_c0_g2~~TRINITY_DN53_c0_g2_i2.p1  ORF type:complete len:151 (+),score=30.29 TRINITY_DN53_c0_g2_i2:60-512(+)